MPALRLRNAVAVAASLALFAAAVPSSANDSPVSGTGKGIAGGALIGEEVGLVTLSVAGAKQTWMYLTIPTALAIGGGIGGYFIEKDKTGSDAQVPMYMLAAGMALIIPSIVITLSANAYNPGSEDSTPPDATPSDSGMGSSPGLGVKVDATGTTTGGGGGGTPTTTPTPPPKHKPSKDDQSFRLVRPPALVNLDDTKLTLALPLISMKPMYTRAEVLAFGQPQRYEVDAPLLTVAF